MIGDMKKKLKMGIVIVSVFVLLALTGFCLYRYFVTDQIMDGGGGMENPDAIEILDDTGEKP